MNINIECPCGAKFTSGDDRGHYINGGGAADDKGRIYQVEVVADRWMEQHKSCPESIRIGKALEGRR